MNNTFDIFNCFNDIYYVTCPKRLEIVWKSKLFVQKFEDKYDLEFIDAASLESITNALPKRIADGFYQIKSIPFEINKDIYYLNKVKNSTEILASSKNTRNIYQNLITTLSRINIKDSIDVQINHIINYVKKEFIADRVSLICPNSNNFKYTVKNDDAKDFYYNPIMKNILHNDDDIARRLKRDKYLFITAADISQVYPDIKEAMDLISDLNFILFKWDIEEDTFYLIIENCKNYIDDRQVYATLYYHLFFILESCLYNTSLYKLSNVDSLTQVFNRNKYTSDYSILLKTNLRKTSVIFVDLDNLKTVNDSFGHALGDKLIKATAKILKESFPTGNIYRIGGDEFVIVCEDTPYDDISNSINIMQERMTAGKIFCSYGISYREINGKFSDMLNDAEREMYIYKRRHHDKYSNEAEKSALTVRLEDDIKNGYYSYVLLPKFDLNTMGFIGAEALVRYNGEDSYASPNEFIPVFENNNCIDLIDYFMIEEVLKLQRYILDNFKKTYPISINVSSQTFLLDKFIDDFVALVDRYDVPNDLIILELTDRVNFSSRKVMLHSEKLNQNSFNLEIDDFVTNTINLKILENNTFSTIKIDKQAYSSISEDSILQKIVKLIIEECHNKNVKVLAEGVENDDDLEFVRSMKFDSAQGYLFDKPLTKEDYIEKYIK